MVMRVTLNEASDIFEVDGVENAPRFDRIEGAFGWLDSSGKGNALFHWFVAAGLTESKKVVFLEEHYGPLHEVGRMAIDSKDRLLIRKIYADYDQRQICTDLCSPNYDGLTDYAHHGRDALKRLQYEHQPEYWSNYRSRSTTAALVPIMADERANVQAGLDRLQREVDQKNTTFRSVFLLPTLLRLPPSVALKHPGVLAMVWVHNAMMRSQFTPKTPRKQPGAYGNLRR